MAIANTIASTFFNIFEFIFLVPKYPPRIPPNMVRPINQVDEIGKIPPMETNPKRPEMEFTKINNAVTAAVCFMFAHPNSSNIGLKIIPPPIPINPDRNPINAPIANAENRFNGFKSVLCFPNKPTNLATANSKTVAKIIL